MDEANGYRLMFKNFILLTVLFISNISLLKSDILGGYSGSETRYGSNAREFALAGALIAVQNSGFSQFSNPALIADVNEREVGISFFSMSLDRFIHTYSYNMHLPPKAGLGIAIYRAGTKNITGRNQTGDVTQNFSNSKIYGIITFAINFTENLKLGLNFKISKSFLTNIEYTNYTDISDNGIGVDLGFLYKKFDDFNIGFRIKNLIGKNRWKYSDTENNYSIYVPKILSLGFKHTYKDFYTIIGQCDISILPIVQNENEYNSGIFTQNDNEILMIISKESLLFRFGIEYEMNELFKFRIGMKSNKLSGGFGMSIPIKKEYSILLDYALDPGHEKEGISHNFSWRIKF